MTTKEKSYVTGKEKYLIFCVHGIGTTDEYQEKNITDFRKCVRKILTEGHYKSKYDFEIQMIDWKNVVDKTKAIDRVKKLHIISNVSAERTMLNMTIPDAMFYATPEYKIQIQLRVSQLANEFYKKFQEENPETFKGKVSMVGHSLGSVISYDLLLR
mmetsp:Transcript_25316/g.17898  ORF Transcript_25316/g.17898 Transcript_25316/m.17898 type:complete len:157 (-) Transcript_25316:794-1264(-)|eukprot:CAMPEP_0116871788 /NCGR_PEP_ID=MMETSP0463-20121206/2281_1 /TAXON_ID=181622 /ORGANISM="Strombidinopsis sp, Strain SopsisLIS2011" /LENGTH=156 /DNA_ID=CAMNT_0004510845 /DNA_START=306 /DNA_END=776 /DNA_ORIENTATION=-